MVYQLVFPPNSPDSLIKIQRLLQSPTRLTLPAAVPFMCQLDWPPYPDVWKSLSHVWLFATPWAIQSMEFSRPEYWAAFPFSRGIFPTQGLNPGLLHCRRILYQLSYQRSPYPDIWSNTIQQVSRKLFFLIRVTFKSNRLWIKQITLHSTGGPHPVSGKP